MVMSFSDPTLAELLNDPVTRAIMLADGVNPCELEETLRRLRRVRVNAHAARRKEEALSRHIGRPSAFGGRADMAFCAAHI